MAQASQLDGGERAEADQHKKAHPLHQIGIPVGPGQELKVHDRKFGQGHLEILSGNRCRVERYVAVADPVGHAGHVVGHGVPVVGGVKERRGQGGG